MNRAPLHTVRTKVNIDWWAGAWTSDWIWVIVVDADTEVTSEQTSFSRQHLLHLMSDRMCKYLTEAKSSRDAELSRTFSSLEDVCVGQPFLFGSVVIIAHVWTIVFWSFGAEQRELSLSPAPPSGSTAVGCQSSDSLISLVGDRTVPLFLGNRSRNSCTRLHPEIVLFLFC